MAEALTIDKVRDFKVLKLGLFAGESVPGCSSVDSVVELFQNNRDEEGLFEYLAKRAEDTERRINTIPNASLGHILDLRTDLLKTYEAHLKLTEDNAGESFDTSSQHLLSAKLPKSEVKVIDALKKIVALKQKVRGNETAQRTLDALITQPDASDDWSDITSDNILAEHYDTYAKTLKLIQGYNAIREIASDDSFESQRDKLYVALLKISKKIETEYTTALFEMMTDKRPIRVAYTVKTFIYYIHLKEELFKYVVSNPHTPREAFGNYIVPVFVEQLRDGKQFQQWGIQNAARNIVHEAETQNSEGIRELSRALYVYGPLSGNKTIRNITRAWRKSQQDKWNVVYNTLFKE